MWQPVIIRCQLVISVSRAQVIHTDRTDYAYMFTVSLRNLAVVYFLWICGRLQFLCHHSDVSRRHVGCTTRCLLQVTTMSTQDRRLCRQENALNSQSLTVSSIHLPLFSSLLSVCFLDLSRLIFHDTRRLLRPWNTPRMRWRPGLRPGPRWGSSRRSPRPLSRLGRGTPPPQEPHASRRLDPRPSLLGASFLAYNHLNF